MESDAGPRVAFRAPVVAARTPPPISGGTLLASRANPDRVIASDPDRDQISIVSLATSSVTTIALTLGDEPGRLAEDRATGLVYVALRGGGAVVTISPETSAIVERRSVCAAPRGIAFDAAMQRVIVACASGEVRVLDAMGGEATTIARLEPDLRDVVVTLDSIYVTHFRSTRIDALTRAGAVRQNFGPLPIVSTQGRSAGQTYQPTAAWRTIAIEDMLAMVHQRSLVEQPRPTTDTPPTTSSADPVKVAAYYSGVAPPTVGADAGTSPPCGNTVVHATVSFFTANRALAPLAEVPNAVLPVDIAVSPDTLEITVVAAGNAYVRGAESVLSFTTSAWDADASTCISTGLTRHPGAVGEVTAVAYTTTHTLLVQSRQPATLAIYGPAQGAPLQTIPLSEQSAFDTGHQIFHSNSGGNIACASCHPEGGDDGHVWTFAVEGRRRTQDLRGGMMARAPFHWRGEERDFARLASDVFVNRMSGPVLTDAQVATLERWIDRQAPAARPQLDAAIAARGRALFEDPTIGCAGCHSGAAFTNSQLMSVGTGAAFKVPSLLGLSLRAPYMHDGCAATLFDRFANTACGGGDSHGRTSQLSDAQIGDLVAYIATL